MPESTGKRNMYVFDINDGEYIRLRGIDFGDKGAKSFAITAAANTQHPSSNTQPAGATVTLRLDSQDGPVIGTVRITATGAADKYRQFTAKVSMTDDKGRRQTVTGVHDLYLCFADASGDVRLDWWQFK